MARDGTRLGVEELVERHLAALYRFAFRLTKCEADAEDLVQETFLIAQQKLHQLRDDRVALAWLFRILRRLWGQQQRRNPPLEPVPVEEIADDAAESDSLLDSVDRSRLFALLDAMPNEFRVPLLLFYFDEFRYREIAEIVGCPLGTVMSRIARGKAFLRARLVPERALDERP